MDPYDTLLDSFLNLSIKDFGIDDLDSCGTTMGTLTQIKIMLEGFPLNRVDGFFNKMNIVQALINGLSQSTIYNEFKNKQLTKDNYNLILPKSKPLKEQDEEDDSDDECYDENGFNEEKFKNIVKKEIYHTLTYLVGSKVLASKIVENNGIEILINLLNEPSVELKNLMLYNLHRLLNTKDGLKSIISNLDKLTQHFELILQNEDSLKYGKGCLVVNVFNIVLDLFKVQNHLDSFTLFLPRLFKYFIKYLIIDLEEEEILFDICKSLFNMADNYPTLYKEFIEIHNKELVNKLIVLFNHPIDTVVSWVIISLERVFNSSSKDLFESYQLNDNEVLYSKMKLFVNKRELRMPNFVLMISLFEGAAAKDDSPIINKLLEQSGLLSQYVELIKGESDLNKLSPQDKQTYQIIVLQIVKIIKLLNQKDLLILLSTMSIIQLFTPFLDDPTLKPMIIKSFEYLIELNNQDIISLFKIRDVHLKIIQSQSDNSILNKLQ